MAAAYSEAQDRHYDLQPEEDYGNLDQDSRDTKMEHDLYEPLHRQARYPTGSVQ
jgi:hypothetical protein